MYSYQFAVTDGMALRSQSRGRRGVRQHVPVGCLFANGQLDGVNAIDAGYTRPAFSSSSMNRM